MDVMCSVRSAPIYKEEKQNTKILFEDWVYDLRWNYFDN